ncbi:unknown [Parabacteroides johnsonii CAG:246]|nr:unknown [Parabacteroides johnsonii CAG:246]
MLTIVIKEEKEKSFFIFFSFTLLFQYFLITEKISYAVKPCVTSGIR